MARLKDLRRKLAEVGTETSVEPLKIFDNAIQFGEEGQLPPLPERTVRYVVSNKIWRDYPEKNFIPLGGMQWQVVERQTAPNSGRKYMCVRRPACECCGEIKIKSFNQDYCKYHCACNIVSKGNRQKHCTTHANNLT